MDSTNAMRLAPKKHVPLKEAQDRKVPLVVDTTHEDTETQEFTLATKQLMLDTADDNSIVDQSKESRDWTMVRDKKRSSK